MKCIKCSWCYTVGSYKPVGTKFPSVPLTQTSPENASANVSASVAKQSDTIWFVVVSTKFMVTGGLTVTPGIPENSETWSVISNQTSMFMIWLVTSTGALIVHSLILAKLRCWEKVAAQPAAATSIEAKGGLGSASCTVRNTNLCTNWYFQPNCRRFFIENILIWVWKSFSWKSSASHRSKT